jgi:hypothetical protein
MFTRERYASMRASTARGIADDRDGFLLALREAGFLPATPRSTRTCCLRVVPALHQAGARRAAVHLHPRVRRRGDSPDHAARTPTCCELNLPSDYLLLNRIQWG